MSLNTSLERALTCDDWMTAALMSDDDFKKRMAGNAHFTTTAAFTFADTGSLLAVESQTTVVGATHSVTNTVLAVDEKAENDEESKPFLRKSCTYLALLYIYDYTVTVTTK